MPSEQAHDAPSGAPTAAEGRTAPAIQVPFARAMGFRLVGLSETHCEMALDYAEHLVGDPDTGVLHGGVVTALLDNVAGVAAFRQGEAVATLDLRIDYLGAATPGRVLFARADCYKRTRNVVFVRAVAYHDSLDDPIAVCTATFMAGTPNARRGSDA